MADSFAFATFFPNVVQPPIAVICNTIFSVLVKVRRLFHASFAQPLSNTIDVFQVRICKRPVRKYDMGSASSSISISLPGKQAIQSNSFDLARIKSE